MKDRTKNSIKPFWSWNDKLEKNELIHQIEVMKQNGIEGFFMHARGGLRTEYMSEEWFDMVEACLDKADELGMQAWAYDENGWPSGFGDGKVPKIGVENQQKMLACNIYDGKSFPESETVIACFNRTENGFEITDNAVKGSYIFTYYVNPYYIDVFNKETISDFINVTHNKYYERFKERFGTSLKGFFTDEPQCGCFPWSFIFPEEFYKDYGYSLIQNLPALMFDIDGSETVRNDFHTMVSRLFRESFIKQMYDWCEEHNCKLTGHLMSEDSIESQILRTGGVMSCYEYFHEPGIDYLGRFVCSPVLPKQLGSVARQLDRKTLTETFALCGWDVSLNELKWIAQWQYLNGVTSLCPHLEGYSLRGMRKRDYPASVFMQLPWFKYVNTDFADYFTSLGALLDSSEDIAPVLLIHPIQSAYLYYKLGGSSELKPYSDRFEEIAISIVDNNILHHYGDETLIERYGSVNGSKIRVGKCEYSTVLLPNIVNLKSNTVNMLLEFIENGGRVYAIDRLPKYENGRKTDNIAKLYSKICLCADLHEFKALEQNAAPISIKCDNESALYLTLKKLSDGRKMLYIINNTKSEQSAKLEITGKYKASVYDILSESQEMLTSTIKDGKTFIEFQLAEYGSAVIYLTETNESYTANKVEKVKLPLDRSFDITGNTVNAITLDKCIYRIDDGEWQSEIAVINLFNDILALQRKCKIDMQFSFNIDEEFDFSSVQLCMENPEEFKILINGIKYSFEDCGMFVDHSIRKSNIGAFLKMGENTVELTIDFVQSPELYYAKFTPSVHESVLNKLTYDTELESIYIIGDFGVKMLGEYTLGQCRCIHGGRKFTLVKPETSLDITDITRQNFWFFSGEIELSQVVDIKKECGKRYFVAFKKLNAPAAQVVVNGKKVGNMAFAPFELEVTDFINDGKNEIKVLMLSGNRNLLGPHHRPYGESYFVGPDTFSNKNSWTDNPQLPPWTDDYSFVLFGAEL